MKCPNCGRIDKDSRVTESRPFKHTVKRKRLCSLCGHKWLTYEATEAEFFSDRNKKQYLSWSLGERITTITLYNNGMSKTEIGKILGRSRMSVSREIDKLTASGQYFSLLEKI